MPRLWAEKLAAGDHGVTLHADWLTSDRPPLATDVILLLYPCFPSGEDGMRLGANSAGMILQLWWIPAIWGFLRHHGNGITFSVATVAALAVTATPLINTLYVWPKLAAAAAVITAGVLYFGDRQRPAARVRGAGLCAALAWLAHGSSAFPLLVLGMAAALFGPWPERRILLQTGALLTALVLPWLVYQQAFAPPANRLAKWHLAGVVEIDNRSTLTTLREAYAALSPAELWQHKRANLRYPFHTGISSWWRWPAPADREDRYQSFYFLAASQGPWNLAWFLLFGLGLRRWWRPADDHVAADTALATTTALLIATFLLWTLLLFGPGTTSVHQGSLAVPLGLSAILMTAAWRTHPAVFGLLAAWQALIFIRVWVPPLSPPPSDRVGALPAAALCLLGALGLVGLATGALAVDRRSPD